MSYLFHIKRGTYLILKRLVNRIPLLKALNRKRRQVKGAKVRQMVVELGPSVSVKVVDVLESGGFEPVLMFGTLLGAVREGQFIRHDNDLDFGVELENNEDWARLRSCMEAAGFKIARQFSFKGGITEQAYYADGFTFDIFGLMPTEDPGERRSYLYCLLDEGKYESPDDRSVKYIDFPAIDTRVRVKVDGVELPIPGNAEECLIRAYTEHWRVPDPTWVTGNNGGWHLIEGAVERRTIFG